MGSHDDLDRVRYPARVRAQTTSDRASAPAAGRETLTQHMQPAPMLPYRGTLFSGAGLKPPDTYKTGHDAIDSGLACEDGDRSGCFLDARRRAEMKSQYRDRVNAALAAFLKAVASAEVTELLKKEPEKIDWVSEILLDVLSTLTIASLKKGMQIAMHAQAEAASAVIDAATEAAPDVPNNAAAAAKLNESIAPLFAAGKRQVSTRVLAPETTQKSANVSYLQVLSRQSTMIFQRLREDVLAGADDHELTALYEAFSAEFHNEEIYGKALQEKLVRFEKSGVGKLGTAKNKNYAMTADLVGAETLQAFSKVETKAFWVRTPGGRKLALYVRGQDPRKLDSTGGTGTDEPGEAEYTLQGYVPGDLVEAAVVIHIAQWGYSPEEHAFGAPEMYRLGASTVGDES